jgi:hypothetical protein
VAEHAVRAGEVARAGDRHEPVFFPDQSFAAGDEVHLVADQMPDFRPNLPSRLAQGTWVPFRAQRAAVRVIVEAKKVGFPPDVHRMAGIEEQANGDLQSLRPRVGFAERGSDHSCARISAPISRHHSGSHVHLAGDIDATSFALIVLSRKGPLPQAVGAAPAQLLRRSPIV